VTALTIRVDGVEKAIRTLEKIGRGAKTTQMRNASSAAGGVLKPEAAKRAPKETGTLAKNFIVKSKVRKDKESAYALIGANRAITVFVSKDQKTNTKKVIATYRTKKDGSISVSGVARLDKAIAKGTRTEKRKPSRYLHLANKKHRFMEATIAAKGRAAAERFKQRLEKGVAEEVAKAK
jgi:hypothetical protein